MTKRGRPKGEGMLKDAQVFIDTKQPSGEKAEPFTREQFLQDLKKVARRVRPLRAPKPK